MKHFTRLYTYLIAMSLGLSWHVNSLAQTPNIEDAARQSLGLDTGVYPVGVPPSYSWYDGGGPLPMGSYGPPAGFTALAGWGQVNPQAGYQNVACNIYHKGHQTWVHKKSGGWILAEDATTPTSRWTIAGGAFICDFQQNSATPLSISVLPSGERVMSSPVDGRCNHWWTQPRGEYPPDTIDGALVMFAVRVDNPNCHMIAISGIDYWQSQSAPYYDDHHTNPAYSGSAWLKLTTQYQWVYSTRFTREQLLADPPPPFIGQTGDTTLPNVAITAPASGATVSGTISLNSNASDNVGVVGVQFLVDGANFGAEDLSAPYSISLNTASLANGTHTISARARDAAGNVRTSAAVSINVSNSIPNPSGGGSGVASPNILLGTTMPIQTMGAVQGDVYNLWSNGTLSQNVNFSAAGNFNLQIEAYGSIAGGVYPIMEVLVDDRVIATVNITSSSLQTYQVNASIGAGTHKIGVGFANDANINGQDRNLYIKRIVIAGASAGAPTPTPNPTPTPTTAVLLGTTMPIRTTGAVQGDVYNIWTNGSLSQNVSFSIAGSYKIAVEAYGSPAGGVNANMQVLVDDKVVAAFPVGPISAVYSAVAPVPAGTHKIGVAFTNDEHVNGQDRNLYIRKITISPN